MYDIFTQNTFNYSILQIWKNFHYNKTIYWSGRNEKVTEINLKVGDAIRKGLQRKGMTQKELAMLVGSTQRSISSYINGNAQPPLDILSLICRILEINMNQILQIPDYNFPGRMLHDPLELEVMKVFDQVPDEKRITFTKLMKSIISFHLE